ncbi:ergothioneine biosynthesis protein EgtB [Simkania sp.]|uniref:ergothioneine biosynthesis protein EgtB n=1 Tax=Simkania sp. TaxID=34094 RepID=UPI003B518D9F
MSIELSLASHYHTVRKQTLDICQNLQVEDFVLQSMEDVSPPKWHLAHTTWFFENFLLSQFCPDYTWFHPQFKFLFNSYYETVGKFHARSRRGLLSRPTTEEVFAYRKEIDQRMIDFLETGSYDQNEVESIVTVGLQHEQQHQELILTDVKYNFFCNPLRPALNSWDLSDNKVASPLEWESIEGGVYEVGFAGESFSYDNEKPRHKTYLQDFELATRLVTNREYLTFIEDRGYEKVELWLSDGWKDLKQSHRKAPLYWEQKDGDWMQFSLSGMVPLNLDEPVCHVSFYEAAAFARWVGRRLPTEFEWEVATKQSIAMEGNFAESMRLHPQVARGNQLFGDCWEWTQSAYAPYPGFQAPFSAIGEYNGKFMCNQQVLRGGSCLTAREHIRPSYRNFFYPHSSWQCAGIRLANAVTVLNDAPIF